MFSLLKFLFRFICWLLVLTLLVAAFAWLANRKDEALLPEVAQALTFTPPSAEAMQRNAYFVFLGLGVPADEDAQAAAARFFVAQMKESTNYQKTGESKFISIEAWPYPPIDKGIFVLLCRRGSDDCPKYWLTRQADVRIVLERYAHVLQRYWSQLDRPEYEEIIPPYARLALSQYDDLTTASDLVLMQATMLMHEGNAAQALSLLERNARLHQRLMAGSRQLVGAMNALSMQVRQQHIVSQLLLHHPALARTHAAQWRAALAARPADLSAALAGEGRSMLRMIDHTYKSQSSQFASVSSVFDESYPNAPLKKALAISKDFLLQKLDLHHTTLNHYYRAYRMTAGLADVPADQFDAYMARMMRELPVTSQPWWRRPYFGLRNWRGYMTNNIFLGVGVGQLYVRSYIERTHDAEGHRRLVLLQLAAYSAGIAPKDMPAWLAKSPMELRNPYTRAPMGWETGNAQVKTGGSLVFQGRQEQSQNPARSSVYRVRVFVP